MKDKMGKTISRLELADYLQSISEMVRSGRFESEGRQWSIPEEILSGIKIKEKKGYIKARIEWAWPTAAEYAPPAQAELAQYQDSFKSIKKRLNETFKQVRQAASAGVFPPETTLAELVDRSRAFAKISDPDWHDAVEIFLDHLENLKRAVAAQDLEGMRHEVRDLAAGMGSCHREFKYGAEGEAEGT